MQPIAQTARRWTAAAAMLAFAACASAPSPLPPGPPRLTLGPIAGDVTATTAVLWARGDRVGRLHAQVRAEGGADALERSVPVFRSDDWTGKIELHGLRPDTTYRVEMRLLAPGAAGEAAGPPIAGRFRTAPPDHERRPVRLAFGGDLAGQNVCRDATEGFPIFRTVKAFQPQIFVGLGDMIYADGICSAVGRYGNAQIAGDFEPADQMLDFWAHWRYTRADPAFRELLSSTAYVGVWDDHEVVNDFGPGDDRRRQPPYAPDVELMPLGLAAFLDYNPLPEAGVPEGRIYRRLRWGRHLELFVLDTRQYRDPADAADDPEAPKSLLGPEQREWLKQGLAASDATWKVVVSSVPLSIPTGSPERRDGWANYKQQGGYEWELLEILGFLRERGVSDTVWITTDVHFASVIRYAPFADSDFRLHEVVTGPLNAGLFANDRMDPTLRGERLFAYWPEDLAAVTTWEQARRFFNFGVLEIDARGVLTIWIVNTAGDIVFDLPLEPPPGA